jgi:HSP20 family protein
MMVEKSHTTGFWPSLADPFRTFGTRLAEWVAPASEASGDDNAYRISIELPGVEEKDISLSAENGIVTLKGEKKTEREEKGETWFFSERQYGSFSRSFRLPPDADESKVRADLKNGVLTVTVPKAKAEEKASRQVKINAA